MVGSVLDPVRRHPLTASLTLGAALFGLWALLGPVERGTIVIDARSAEAILVDAADRQGRELSDEEQGEALRTHADEEMLVREAHRRGLHLVDPTARGRLLRRLRSELSQGLVEPTPAQLRAYHLANRSRYPGELEQVETMVRLDWMRERRAELWEERLAEIRERFEVVVERGD